MSSRPLYIYCCLLISCFQHAFSQQGNSYLSNFSTATYKGSDQNWSAVQDSAGKLFFANLNGVIMYDGKFWKTDTLSREASAFSLDKDSHGRIYVGGDNQFGYLIHDTKGAISYHSLSDSLKGDDREFAVTWATHCIGNEVFFCSNEKIFWYHNGHITALLPGSGGFHTFFKVGGHLFVREFDKGFSVFEHGRLNFIRGSEEFADKKVYSIQNLQGNTYIVATRNNGIYMLYYNAANPAKSVFVRHPSLIDDWLRDKELYCGARLDENHFTFGSLKDGLVITDRNFRITGKLNSSNGLQDDAVKNIFKDANDNLWLCLNSGISFYEHNTPITFWNKNDGIGGVVENVISFHHSIYAATDKGLMRCDGGTSAFSETPVSVPCFALAASKDRLFIAAPDEGLYLYDGKSYTLVFDEAAYSVMTDGDTLFVGTENSLYRGLVVNGKFKPTESMSDIGAVRSIARDAYNNVAAGTSANGVHILTARGQQMHLLVQQGLPGVNENRVFNYEGEIYISTDDGFYKWDHAKPAVVTRDKAMNAYPAKAKVSITTPQQVRNEVWFQSTRIDKIKDRVEEIGIMKPGKEGFVLTRSYLDRIQGATVKQFFPDSGQVFIATNQGLFRYDLDKTPKTAGFSVVVSRAFFGDATANYIENYSGGDFFSPSELPYRDNELTVYPSATSFFGPEFIEFSSYLDGEESGFQPWNTTSPIKYNNIQEGTYTFHIKAKDMLGRESAEVSFSFTILPPWYRSTLAYLLYIVLAVGFVVLFVRIYTRRLKQRNINLEKVITERTSTIVLQKKELEHKNQEITDSINYAKRIQLSILPEVKSIKQQWEDVFIFYQPKDIVSGDFYWYKKLGEHEFLIAVADCTGHGVPGGFMSMICSDKLHQASEISTSPDMILFHANNAIKDALKQGNIEGGTKDGMEIALVKVDTVRRAVSYSGANRFLWVVDREGGFTEIKPTKAGIASTTEYDFNYELHELDLQKGDCLYLSSDGYPDQFGGPDGKKYMTKNFKQYIRDIAPLPIAEQETRVADNINQWMEGYEQVDDLLVIGIRL